jgi:hypothetical protein
LNSKGTDYSDKVRVLLTFLRTDTAALTLRNIDIQRERERERERGREGEREVNIYM